VENDEESSVRAGKFREIVAGIENSRRKAVFERVDGADVPGTI
jgi:hypothetical protein